MEVQTRGNGILQFWPTISEAFSAAKEDESIWKISWTNESTDERVRLVRRDAPYGGHEWIYSPIVLPETSQ